MKQKLRQYELYNLLRTLKTRQATGLLMVESGTGVFEIYLRQGAIVYLHTADTERSLPAFLLKAGLIEKGVLRKVIAQARSKGQGFEESAIELEVFTAEELARAKSNHQNALLAFVLSLKSVDIELKEKPLPPALNTMPAIDPFPALCHAVAAKDDNNYMRSILEPMLLQGLRIDQKELSRRLPVLKSSMGDHEILYWLQEGDFGKITVTILEDDTALRILFLLYLDDMLGTSEPETDEQQDEIIASLAGNLSKMIKLNYYEILGVTIDAPLSLIDSRYKSLKRRFSSTRYEGTHYQDKAKDLLKQIHELLDKARNTLVDKNKRSNYNRLMKIDSPAMTERLDAMFEAQALFENGLKVMDSGAFNDAELLFKQAVETFKDDILYTAYLVKVRLLSCRGDCNLDELRDALKKALHMNPEHPEILYTMAQLETKAGNAEQAINYARRTLSQDPENLDARALLRIHTSSPGSISLGKGSKIQWQRIFDVIKGGGKR